MVRSRFARRLGLAVAITALVNGAPQLRHSTLALNRAADAHAAGREVGGDAYVGVGGHSLALLITSVAGDTRGATNPSGRPVRGADVGSTRTIPLPPPPGSTAAARAMHSALAARAAHSLRSLRRAELVRGCSNSEKLESGMKQARRGAPAMAGRPWPRSFAPTGRLA